MSCIINVGSNIEVPIEALDRDRAPEVPVHSVTIFSSTGRGMCSCVALNLAHASQKSALDELV